LQVEHLPPEHVEQEELPEALRPKRESFLSTSALEHRGQRTDSAPLFINSSNSVPQLEHLYS